MRSNTHNRAARTAGLRPGRWLLGLTLLVCASAGARADNATPGCGLTIVNGAANDCYTVTPPAPVGALTVNGFVSPATEWNGAIQKSLSTAGFDARVRFLHNGQNLVFLIAVNDADFNVSDRIALSFDPLHNHAATADDITFIIRREGTGHTRNGAVWNPGANLAIKDATVVAAGPRSCTGIAGCVVPDFPTGWAVELTITPADLGLADLSAILGFTLKATNADSSDETTWPDPAPAPANYANIKSRYPIEYMVVLDKSGSMLDESRWTNAKSAANILANMLFALKDGYFDDRVGLVTFSSDCFTNANTTTIPNALAVQTMFPGSYVLGGDPSPNNCTPIGWGLDAAFGASALRIVQEPNKEAQRVVLLLSDGFHNTPTSTLLPADLLGGAADPCPAIPGWNQCPPATVHKVQVHTVALGNDATVDTGLLTNIKNRFAGQRFQGGNSAFYNITSPGNPDLLKQFFISTLDDIFHVNSIAPGDGQQLRRQRQRAPPHLPCHVDHARLGGGHDHLAIHADDGRAHQRHVQHA